MLVHGLKRLLFEQKKIKLWHNIVWKIKHIMHLVLKIH
jgi:hypothetical protein